jgi:hypothetical protein
VLSVLRGFKSKKLQALQPPAELEPAAFTITYLEAADAGAGKEAKKKHVHLLALQSHSATAWCSALESLCATPASASSASPSPVRSLEDAQRAATTATLGFDSGAESNVRFHSLLAKHYSHLHLPVLLRQSSSDATAELQQQLLQQQQAAAPPQLPSRRKSAFHSDYLSTKGFTAAPSHARSLTLSMLNTAAAAARGTSATGSPLASPTLARTLDDVLPLLRRGCYFLKFGRSGPPKFRFLVLSEDLLTLCPYERGDDIGGKAPAKGASSCSHIFFRAHRRRTLPWFGGSFAMLASDSLLVLQRSTFVRSHVCISATIPRASPAADWASHPSSRRSAGRFSCAATRPTNLRSTPVLHSWHSTAAPFTSGPVAWCTSSVSRTNLMPRKHKRRCCSSMLP